MNCCQQRCVISCGHGGDGGGGYGNASTALVIMLVNCTRPPLRYDLTLHRLTWLNFHHQKLMRRAMSDESRLERTS